MSLKLFEMPICSVKVCKNRSDAINKASGITYHRFPKSPTLKEKWIQAANRDDAWFPTKNSVICSAHFEEHNFLPLAKSRRLFASAVPTLKLRLVFETPSHSKRIKLTSKKTIKQCIEIEKYKKAIVAHKDQIKRLQTIVRIYRKKSDKLENILEALKNENAISVEHQWLLESVHLS